MAARRTRAQQPKTYRIGLLSALAPPSDTSPFIAPLIRSLDKFGYVLGRNLVFERRGAEGKLDRLPQLAQELVESKIDVAVVIGFPAALAVRQASGVPAVTFAAGDPVATGLVQSMARPGGNMTGVSDIPTELTAKRLELLRDLAPRLRRVAMLWNASDLGMTLRYQASEAAVMWSRWNFSLRLAVAPAWLAEPVGVAQPATRRMQARTPLVLVAYIRLRRGA